jgi:hypothetical protein
VGAHEAIYILNSVSFAEIGVTVDPDRCVSPRRIVALAEPSQGNGLKLTSGRRPRMTRNLQARDDFEKGDVGCATGHQVIRTTGPGTPMGSFRVTALQRVKAGTNGWFEDQRSK